MPNLGPSRDNDEKSKEKKNPAAAKPVRKRRRKGPVNVAKIPQGKLI